MKMRAGMASPKVNQVQRVKARNICLVDLTREATLVPCSVRTCWVGLVSLVRIV